MFRLLKSIIILVFFCGLFTGNACATGVVGLLNEETAKSIQVLLEDQVSQSAPLIGVTRLFNHEQIHDLYKQRQFMPVWLDGWQPKPGTGVLIETLRNAGSHGLCNNDYLLAQLERLLHIQNEFAKQNLPLTPENRAVLDLFLSQAFLTYASHMIEGQVDPALTHVDWRARRRKANLVKLLEYAVGNQRLAQVLEDLVPPHEGYRQLVDALEYYQEISAAGGWPMVRSGRTIRPGDIDQRVPKLRQRLQKTGDFPVNQGTGSVYDPELEAAVRVFQARHGLEADGLVGRKTFDALNIPVEERIRQIELNLERWRWMPKSFGKKYIRVNVAGFSLEVVEEEKVVLQMPVIVGTQYRKTPVFSARLTYLEFAPYWTVPPTILREDKLPKIKSNPEYLASHHYRILARGGNDVEIDPGEIDWQDMEAKDFPGMLRMEPGPWNPLGRVKFMFPNRFNVYLHDTNERYLFDRNVRSFSSGCIRIREPFALAHYLLKNELGVERLQELFSATTPEQVSIDPLSVHIQYWTAWVDNNGLVNFRPDVYYRDLDLEIALNDPSFRIINQLKASSGSHFAQVD